MGIADRHPDDLVRELRARRINVHALARSGAVLDFDQKGVEGALRVSPHYYNTEAEVDALAEALGAILARP